MSKLLHHAHSIADDEEAISHELMRDLGSHPAAIVLFFAGDRPGEQVAQRLTAAYPGVPLLACLAAGELSSGRHETQSVVAAGLDRTLIVRSAVALADYTDGMEGGLNHAVKELERTFGPLAALDPTRHVGIILLDSLHAIEEATHVLLGNHAPLLSFVGGSSGNFGFDRSRIVTSQGATSHGCGLMLLEVARPFHVAKTCHFGPTQTHFVATKVRGRQLFELDGRPAAQVYAEYIGCPPEQLSYQNLLLNPIGLVIDGESWLRQVWPPIQHEGSIFLGCEVAEGTHLTFMKPLTDLVTHQQRELARTRAELGELKGALLFDCIGRRSELELTGQLARYMQLFDLPAVGFNTVGESWIGHMAQTLTAIYFR